MFYSVGASYPTSLIPVPLSDTLHLSLSGNCFQMDEPSFMTDGRCPLGAVAFSVSVTLREMRFRVVEFHWQKFETFCVTISNYFRKGRLIVRTIGTAICRCADYIALRGKTLFRRAERMRL